MISERDKNYKLIDEINQTAEDSLSFLRKLADSKQLLTPDEELGLGHRIKTGIKYEGKGLIGTRIVEETPDGREALDEMVFCNLRLAFGEATKWAHGNPEKLLKYCQAGIIGLTVAALKFDPERGTKFSTTATNWVRNAVKTEVRNEDGRKIPSWAFDKWMEIWKMVKAANPDMGKKELIEEIAKRLEISPEEVRVLVRSKVSQVSLQAPVEGAEGDLEMGDGVAADEYPIEEIVIRREENRLVRRMYGDKTIWGGKKYRRNRLVIQFRGGVITRRLTMEEVGEIFRMSKQGVFKVETDVNKRAKDWLWGMEGGQEIMEGRLPIRDSVSKQERNAMVVLSNSEQIIVDLVESGLKIQEVAQEMKLTVNQAEKLFKSAMKKIELVREEELIRTMAGAMIRDTKE